MPEADQPLLPSAAASLEQAFGVPFDVWAPSPPWTRALAREGATTDQLASDLAVELAGRLGPDRDPVVIPQSQNRHLLAIPLAHDNKPCALATASFETSSPELLVRLARVYLESRHDRRRLDQLAEENEAYVLEISQCFEELTFLRRVGEYLEVADVSLGMFCLAETILPLLLELVRAETLAFLPAESPAQGRGGGLLVVSSPSASRSEPIDREICRKLVESCRASAARGPVVRNRCAHNAEQWGRAGIRQSIVAPVAKGDLVMGWLIAVNCLDRASWSFEPSCEMEFGTVEAGLLACTASILATHARNIDLFHQKEQLFFGAVRSLVSAIEARDRYTCGHSERVALFARRLASELGLSEVAAKRIYLSGLLHDVGKIGVPDVTLLKPGRLTDEEFSQIKRHPDQGWSILHGLTPLGDVLPAVVHHHEAFDGSGYPDGLAGEAIPLGSRILAVADTYDALTSDRPYRTAMSQEKAEDVLRQGGGRQWDPQVVEAFLRAMPDIIGIRQSYRQPEAACRSILPAAAPALDPTLAPLT